MNLKIVLHNCQDLYVFMDKYKENDGTDIHQLSEPKWQLLSTSFFPNKDLKQLHKLAVLYNTIKPDIIMLVEVGGKESLANFNKFFLNNKYDVLLQPSNSNRGIDLGYLVSKKLSLTPKLISYTNDILENGKKVARGFFELQLIRNNKPIFINFLCHLKSKLNLDKKDFEGRSQRAAEVNFLKKIYLKRNKEFPNIPIAISGDLNAVIYKDETEPELEELLTDTGLKDTFELLKYPLEQRITYCYFDKKQDRYDMQLDYFLLNKKYLNSLDRNETKVLGFFPFHDPVYPQDISEKRSHPSDHFPLQISLNL